LLNIEDIERIELGTKCNKFKYVKPVNYDKSLLFIKKLVAEPDRKVALKGDWDVDGVFSTKIVFNLLLEAIGRERIIVNFGTSKDHGVNIETIKLIKNEGITDVIIMDSSTNNMSELTELCDSGVNVMILDHHLSDYSYTEYPANCCIINSKMKGNEEIKEISAGFLCYLVTSFWRNDIGLTLKPSDMILGYVTLIADGCMLHDPYIRPVILGIKSIQSIPDDIKLFMNQYSKISRNFISFSVSNMINDLCRNDDEKSLLELFFEDRTNLERASMVEKVISDQKARKIALDLMCKEYENFTEDLGSCTLSDLNKIEDLASAGNENIQKALAEITSSYILNATGLISMRIAKLCGKPTLVYKCISGVHMKASGRCTDTAFPFKPMCEVMDFDGGGHPGAYGFKFYTFDLDRLKSYCRLLKETKASLKQYTVIDLDDVNPLFRDRFRIAVSRHNEIAFGDVLPIYVKVHLNRSFNQNKFKKMIQYKDNFVVVKDLMGLTDMGDTVLANPQFSDPTMFVVEVLK